MNAFSPKANKGAVALTVLKSVAGVRACEQAIFSPLTFLGIKS